MAGVVSNSPLQQEREQDEEAEIMVAEKEKVGIASASTQIVTGLGGRSGGKYQSFWIDTRFLAGLKIVQKEFQPRPDDIYLASPMKSGTTWLKALLNTILSVTECMNPGDRNAGSNNNRRGSVDEKNPHLLVPTMECTVFHTINRQYGISMFSTLPSPRLLHTHSPFDLLPPLLKSSLHCKIIYIVRNPRDVFVSLWKFYSRTRPDGIKTDADLNKEEVFDAFCSGLFHGGPFPESVLSYWRESRRNPNKVMFLSYEDLQEDCVVWVKRIGAFIGCSPLLLEEHAQRIVDKCSFDNLSKVNPTGNVHQNARNSDFFREGKVGEWIKHFTPEMQERIHREIEQKFDDEGFHFTFSNHDLAV